MNRILLFVLLTLCSTNMMGQVVEEAGEIICHGIHEDKFVRIPPPENFAPNNQGARQNNATIDVRYNGFSDEAKDAFQFAVDIWASLLQSEVTITIIANWQTLGNGVLGTASPGETFRNFDGAPLQDIEYPAALAEKLARKTLNSSGSADITANFNNSVDWYFGTDGNTPAGKFDLVTVVLHELGHGLGITGSVAPNNGITTARWGAFEGNPRIYDYFMVNNLGQQLIDETLFTNNSGEMLSLVSSNNLFFNSPIAQGVNGGTNPRLFSPSPFNPGSSVSHLDEADFPSGNDNSLMTPFVGSAEAIHDPGEIVMGMFADMGWVYTFLTHQELNDTENEVDPITFSLQVDSDNGVMANSVKLIYSDDNFTTTNELVMQTAGNPTIYEAELSNPGVANISYYFTLIDVDGRTFNSHEMPLQSSFSFSIGPDQQAPVISHEPDIEYFDGEPNPIVLATITDNVGLDTAYVEYNINGNVQMPVGLTLTTENQYQVELLLQGNTNPGDEVTYKIIARDLANTTNEATDPTTGSFTFPVFGVVESYENNFDEPSNDFVGEFFSTETPSGFSSGAIHSQHPYPSPVVNTDTNFTYQLKFNISIINEGAFLKYDDVALVEPGVAGSVFGISAFKDYVVVEASNDQGASWMPLADGYDASFNADWQTLYESNIVDEVSEAEPTDQLYVNHEILLTETFSIGDELSIRFRLFANDNASGWGWVIDNLEIQGEGEITGLRSKTKRLSLLVKPNPASNDIRLSFLQNQREPLNVSVHDLSGKAIFTADIPRSGENKIDVSKLKEGVYILIAKGNTQYYTQRLMIER